jgi:hypothetical protein
MAKEAVLTVKVSDEQFQNLTKRFDGIGYPNFALAEHATPPHTPELPAISRLV